MSTDCGTWQTEADISDKERYQRYLTSREWGLLRQQVKARSGGICERCKYLPSESVHHLTYQRKYNERPEDLQDLCDGCHRFTHGLSDADPMSCLASMKALQELKIHQGMHAVLVFVLEEVRELSDDTRGRLSVMIKSCSDRIEELCSLHEVLRLTSRKSRKG